MSFLHSSTADHWEAIKRILRYIKGAINLGLEIRRVEFGSCRCFFFYVDWAGCPDDRRSTIVISSLVSQKTSLGL